MPMLHQNVVTAHVDADSLPWVPFTPYSDEVMLKYFKVDPVRGEEMAKAFERAFALPPEIIAGAREMMGGR